MNYQQAMDKAREMLAYYRTRVWVCERKGIHYVVFRPEATVNLNVVAILG